MATKSTNFIRVLRRDRYSTFDHSLLRDSRLSYAARGLLCYVLSRPNNWRVNNTDLINQSPAGRDAVNTLLKELKRFNYLRRIKTKGEHGQFQWETIVSETPLTEQDVAAIEAASPSTAFPYMDDPSMEQPDTEAPEMDAPETDNTAIKEVMKEDVLIEDVLIEDKGSALADAPPVSESSKPETDHQRLMRAVHELFGSVDLTAAQGKSAKRMLASHHSVHDIIACMNDQVRELKPNGWRTSVSLMTVEKDIGAFKFRRNGNGSQVGKHIDEPATPAYEGPPISDRELELSGRDRTREENDEYAEFIRQRLHPIDLSSPERPERTREETLAMMGPRDVRGDS